jgi:Domain of unknown function (DUF4416)
MGTPAEPKPAKYFVGLLSSDAALLSTIEQDLAEVLGLIDERSETSPWNASDYYKSEMGSGLLRCFLSFARLASPGELAAIKLKAQQIEAKYCVPSSKAMVRRVNVDPGYVDAAKVVLASTKNAGHRIYLGSGIYAETALFYYNGAFQFCHYTYPDFRWPQTLSFLRSVRDSYLEQLRQSRNDRKTGQRDATVSSSKDIAG